MLTGSCRLSHSVAKAGQLSDTGWLQYRRACFAGETRRQSHANFGQIHPNADQAGHHRQMEVERIRMRKPVVEFQALGPAAVGASLGPIRPVHIVAFSDEAPDSRATSE